MVTLNKRTYKLLDSLVRRLDRLEAEEYNVWPAVSNRLVKREIEQTKAIIKAKFSDEQVSKIRLMQSRTKSRHDRYTAQRWVWFQVHNKLGYHGSELIERVTDKLRAYYWDNYNAALHD